MDSTFIIYDCNLRLKNFHEVKIKSTVLLRFFIAYMYFSFYGFINIQKSKISREMHEYFF